MKNLFLIIFFNLFPFSVVSFALDYGFDHAIIVVNDLKKASQDYSNLGFKVKPGRLHDNGLLNAHIKFSNFTGLELMSVATETEDIITKRYVNFLSKGEGGVYIAIKMNDVILTSELLNSAGVTHLVTKSGVWTYITFPKSSNLETFFLIKTEDQLYTDDGLYYLHENGVENVNTIYVEGGIKVKNLLMLLGAKQCNFRNNVLNLAGTNFMLLPPVSSVQRRFLGIGITQSEQSTFNNISNLHGIWIKRSRSGCQNNLINE